MNPEVCYLQKYANPRPVNPEVCYPQKVCNPRHMNLKYTIPKRCYPNKCAIPRSEKYAIPRSVILPLTCQLSCIPRDSPTFHTAVPPDMPNVPHFACYSLSFIILCTSLCLSPVNHCQYVWFRQWISVRFHNLATTGAKTRWENLLGPKNYPWHQILNTMCIECWVSYVLNTGFHM